VDVEEEKSLTPESPLSPTPKDEDPTKLKDTTDDDRSPDSKQPVQKSSLRIRTKRKKSISPQNGGDADSQNSFSRTSSTCGYRESFGNSETVNFRSDNLLLIDASGNCRNASLSSLRSGWVMGQILSKVDPVLGVHMTREKSIGKPHL